MVSFKSLSFLILTLIVVLFLIQTLPSNSVYGRKKSRRSGMNLKGTTPLEARFFSDLEAGRTDRWSLGDAFLIASGLRTERQFKKGQEWINQIARNAKDVIAHYRSTEQKADQLLKWLHGTALRRYRATSTDAVEIMKYGRFNCLSSCILYGIIGQKLGMKVRGIAVDKHAFCRVYRGRKGWDVETTNALGFNPGRTLKLDNRIVSVPRSQYRNRREITLKEMIGLIYSNHMGLSNAFPTPQDQILALQKALYFFPRDPIIQHNLIAAHTQAINRLIDQKSWTYAWAYVKQLKKYEKDDKYWSSLAPQLIKSHLQKILTQGRGSIKARIDQALTRLKEYAQDEPGLGKQFIEYMKAWIYGFHLKANSRSKKQEMTLFEQSIQSLKKGQKARKGALSRQFLGILKQNTLAALKNHIISYLNAQDFDQAMEFVRIALRAFPRDLDLRKYQKQMKTVQIHRNKNQEVNRIVALAKKNKLLEAIRALNQAQQRDPHSAQLRKLRRKIEPTFMYNEIIGDYEDEDFEGVKRKIKIALRKYPRDRDLLRLKRDLERELEED